MGLYLSIFLIAVCAAFLNIMGLTRRDSMILFSMLVLLFWIMSFIRWETGTDWQAYEGFFNWSSEWGKETVFEPGFAFLNTLVRQFTDNYTVMLCLEGGLIALFTALAIRRFSPFPLLSIFIVWCTLLGNVMFVRQAIATSILFYSVRYIIDKEKINFLIWVLLATLIHRTSLIFLLAWPIFHLRWPMLWMWGGLTIAIILSTVIGQLFMSVSSLFGEVIQTKINLYLGEGSDDNTFGTGFSMAMIIAKGLINKAFILLIGWFTVRHLDPKQYPHVRGFFNLFWFGCIIFFMTIPISTGMARFSYSYDIMQVVLIPYIFIAIRSLPWKIAIFLTLTAYLAMRMFVYINNFYNLYVPFKTFLNA